MFDDMISTAGSITGAAKLVHKAGAREIHVAATHDVFCGPALDRIREAPITSLIVTDTVCPILDDSAVPDKIRYLTVAPFLPEAIKRTHYDQTNTNLFQPKE